MQIKLIAKTPTDQDQAAGASPLQRSPWRGEQKVKRFPLIEKNLDSLRQYPKNITKVKRDQIVIEKG